MAKLSISQAWDETRLILARDGKLIAAVALALFVLPGIVLNVAVPKMPTGQMREPGAWMLIAFAVLLITLIGQLAIVRLSLAPHIAVGEAITRGARRLGSYVGAFLLWSVPLLAIGSFLYTMSNPQSPNPSVPAALGLLAVTALGVFISVRLILLSAVASAESGGPIAILQRSWELSRGNWWRLFGFAVMLLIAAMVAIWAVSAVIGVIARLAFGDLTPLSIGGLIVVIVGQLLSAVISVILLVMIARLYSQRTGAASAQASVPSSGI
jgi:hypothetical protein